MNQALEEDLKSESSKKNMRGIRNAKEKKKYLVKFTMCGIYVVNCVLHRRRESCCDM